MVDRIVMAMTDEQKQMVVDAKEKDVVCVAKKTGDKFCGLVNVMTAKGISSTVARTKNVFDDDAEAMDVAEGVVDAILDAEPELKLPEEQPQDDDETPTAEDGGRDIWDFYQDAKGEWRWRRTDPNGEIVGAATEGYENRIDCESNARRNGWEAEPKRRLLGRFAGKS